MLKSVLSSEKCRSCRNCCVFFSESRWEMPSVTLKNTEKIKKFLNNEDAVEKYQGIYKLKSVLRDNIIQGREEYKCPALDENKGCTLPAELKPVECSMWPVRVMDDNGRLFVTLASGCCAVDDCFIDNVSELVQNGLLDKIKKLLRNDRGIIKKYDNSYLKIAELTEEKLKYEQ